MPKFCLAGLWRYIPLKYRCSELELKLIDEIEMRRHLEDQNTELNNMINVMTEELLVAKDESNHQIILLKDEIDELRLKAYHLEIENKRLKTGKGLLVYDAQNCRWVPSYCSPENIIGQAGVPVKPIEKEN